MVRQGTPSLVGPAVAGMFGLGLALTSATQLRPGGLPVGPGEVLLALFVGCGLFAALIFRRLQLSPTLAIFGAFWGLTFAALSFGWVFGLFVRRSSLESGRDFLAFGLAAAAVLVAASNRTQLRFAEVSERVFAAASVLLLGALSLLALVGGGSVGPIAVWYEGLRFRGWAENPNQLGLLLLPVPAILGRWAAQSAGVRAIALIAAMVLSVAFGLATRSDALLLAWTTMGAGAAFLVWRRALRDPRPGIFRGGLIRVVVPLGFIGALLLSFGPLVSFASSRLSEIYEEGGQGSERIDRWEFGVSVLESAPIVGFGPGSFSGRNGPYEGHEAHNTPIDWAASTGFVGLGLLIALVVVAVVRAARRRSYTDLIVLAGLTVFSQFHYVLRQPLCWFLIFMALARPDHPSRDVDISLGESA